MEYSGIVNEHTGACERSAGLFDVSHMGEIEIAGKDALAGVQRISSQRRARSLQRRAGAILRRCSRRAGTFVDDLLVYRLATEHFLLVVNAGQHRQGLQHGSPSTIAAGRRRRQPSTRARGTRCCAVQGPEAIGHRPAAHRASTWRSIKLLLVRPRRSRQRARARSRAPAIPGEDGFEIFVPPQSADRVWQAILDVRRRRADRRPVRPRRARYAAPRGGHASVGAAISTKLTTVLEADLRLDRRLEER